MTVRSWIRAVFARPAARPAREGPPRPRLGVEGLEDRTVPATFTVTTTADSGDGSLRQAILDANAQAGADVIRFAPSFSAGPQTITLTGGELHVTDAVGIQGPGGGILTVSGNNASRVFDIDDGHAGTSLAVAISGLTVTGGKNTGDNGGIPNGGGIFN